MGSLSSYQTTLTENHLKHAGLKGILIFDVLGWLVCVEVNLLQIRSREAKEVGFCGAACGSGW